jgi:Protein of unknown function (DUF2892)
MNTNMSPIDQLIRIIIGVTAGWEYLIVPSHHWWLILFSFGFLMSGWLGSCPIYGLFGVSTYRAKPQADELTHRPSR